MSYAPSYFEWAAGKFPTRMTATEVLFRQRQGLKRTADDAIEFTDETYEVREMTDQEKRQFIFMETL